MHLDPLQIIILSLSWIAYGAIHSLLAALGFKALVARHAPALMPSYRILFNLLGIVLLVPPLWLTFSWSGPLLWAWTGIYAWLANALALAALAGFAVSSRYYDMGSFTGLAQWRSREHAVEDLGGFRLSPLHRYVRHPWYALGLVILWTRDMDEARLLSTVFISLYLWIGSLFEERKLRRFHGEAYARYQARVPGLFPLPGRSLSAGEARELEAMSHPQTRTP
jgi:protein-S-isoprenylcysteine O-methyltransferase Ste14